MVNIILFLVGCVLSLIVIGGLIYIYCLLKTMKEYGKILDGFKK
jgi:Tfp pilus assembly protein PilW